MASGGLGSLTFDLLLEVAEWVSGLDKSERETQKFCESVKAKFDDMSDSALSSLKKMAAGAAAAFSAHEILEFIESAEHAAHSLDLLAQKTGQTIEGLAQLSVFAQMAGGNVEGLSRALGKLDQAMVKARAGMPAGKGSTASSSGIFAGLGIDVGDKSPSAVLQEVADAFYKLEDGAEKTAAAIAIFGKGGAELIPILNQMGGASDELRAATEAYGTVMATVAAQSHELHDNLAVLHTRTATLGGLLAEQFIPYITKLTEQLVGLNDATTKLPAPIEALVNAFKGIVIAGDLVVSTIMALGEAILTLTKAFLAMSTGNIGDIPKILSDGWSDVKTTLEGTAERIKALVDPFAQVEHQMDKDAAAAARLKKALGELGAPVDPDKQAEDYWQKELIELGKYTKKYEQAQAELTAKAKAAADKRQKAIEDELVKNEMARRKAEEQDATEAEKTQKEITKAEAEAAAAELKIQKEANDAANKYILDEAKKRHDEERALYGGLVNDIVTLGEDAFQNLFDSTGDGWKNMLDGMAKDFKKLLINFIEKQVIQPLILNIVAQAGGGIGQYASSLLGQPGGQGIFGSAGTGTGGDFSGLVGGAQKAYDYFFGGGEQPVQLAGPGAEASGGSMWTSSGGGLATAGAGVVGGVAGYGAARLAGAGQRGQSAAASYGATGAAIGMQVYGPIGAAVGWAIGTLAGIATDPDPDAMRKAKFGTMQGAKGPTDYKYTSALGTFGISDTQWFSDKDMGAQLKAFITTMQGFDNAIAAALKPEEVEKLKARLADMSKEYEFGMEHGDVQGLGEIIKDRIGAMVDTIAPEFKTFFDAFSGDVQDLGTVFGAYMSMRNVSQFDPEAMVKSINDANAAKADEMTAYQAQIKSANDLITAWDGSAASTTAVTQAIGDFQAATVQLIEDIQAAAAAMHTMFMSTADAIKQSVMSPEEKYQYLQSQSASLFDQLQTETDPAKIQALAQKINDDINAAWGMLGDSDRQGLAQQYVDRINALDQAVADKMNALQSVVVEDSNTMMHSVADRMDSIFQLGAQSAATQEHAAELQLEAAQTTPPPAQVVIPSDIVNASG